MSDGSNEGGAATPAPHSRPRPAEEEEKVLRLQIKLKQHALQQSLDEGKGKRVRSSSPSCKLEVDAGITRLQIDCVGKSVGEVSSLSDLKRLYGSFTRLAQVDLQVKDVSEAETILSELEEYERNMSESDEKYVRKRPVREMLTQLSIATWSPQCRDFLERLLEEKNTSWYGQELTYLQAPFQFVIPVKGPALADEVEGVVFDMIKGWHNQDPPSYIQWGPVEGRNRNSLKREMGDWTEATVLRLEYWRPPFLGYTFDSEHFDPLFHNLANLQFSAFLYHLVVILCTVGMGVVVGIVGAVGVMAALEKLRLARCLLWDKVLGRLPASTHVSVDQLRKELQDLQDFVLKSRCRLHSLSLLWAAPCVPDVSVFKNLTSPCVEAWVDHEDRGWAWSGVIRGLLRLRVLELAVNVKFWGGYVVDMIRPLRELRTLRIFWSCSHDAWLRFQNVLNRAPLYEVIMLGRDTCCPFYLLNQCRLSNLQLQVIELRGAWSLSRPANDHAFKELTKLTRLTNLQSCVLTLPERDARDMAAVLGGNPRDHAKFPPFPFEVHMPLLAYRFQPGMVRVKRDWLVEEHRAWMQGSKVFRRGIPL